MADHSKNIIEVKDVSFGYGEKEVIQNVSLNIHEGDYLGIIGPNGGGKSTLIKLIIGLIKPQRGSIAIFGTPIEKFKDWYKIGYVAQKRSGIDLSFPVTVEQVVSMGRYFKPNKSKVRQIMEDLEITSIKNRLIGNLSGGQQQKVFVARALVSDPQVIFLDEPTSGIDSASITEFYALLKKLNQEKNITLVLISHDIDVVTKEVTEIAAINEKLVYYGSAREFKKEEHHDRLYVKELEFYRHD